MAHLTARALLQIDADQPGSREHEKDVFLWFSAITLLATALLGESSMLGCRWHKPRALLFALCNSSCGYKADMCLLPFSRGTTCCIFPFQGHTSPVRYPVAMPASRARRRAWHSTWATCSVQAVSNAQQNRSSIWPRRASGWFACTH